MIWASLAADSRDAVQEPESTPEAAQNSKSLKNQRSERV